MPDLSGAQHKNYVRLLFTCAMYRQRHRAWPNEVRLEPAILRDLAHLLDPEQFERLAAHVRLATRDSSGLSAGGPQGVVQYDFEHGTLREEVVELTRKWLDIHPRDEG